MREFVEIEVLATLVVMMRAGTEGAILLSNDDEESRFYEGITHPEARVISAPNRALDILRIMESKGIQGLAAAVCCANSQPAESNVFQPYVGDTTSLLLLSMGCEKVIQDICGNAWMAACQKEVGSIRQRGVWLACVLGRVRQLCEQHGVPFSDEMDLPAVIDWHEFKIAWLPLRSVLLQLGLPAIAIDPIESLLPTSDIRAGLVECDGIDVVRLISAATSFYRPRGIAAAKTIDASGLLSMLRVAFDPAEFEEDQVFWRVRFWERSNVRYPLLRGWRILDPLGSVWDQRYWQKDLAAMLGMLGSGDSLAMFKMDLDDFKKINDCLGHGGGDDAIRFYCEVVKRTLGLSAEVYRRGGDELVALAPSISESCAEQLAEKCRSSIEGSFQIWSAEHGLKIAPTASIGVVLAKAGQSSSEVSKLADIAQMRAKHQGKNRVVVGG